MWVKVIHEFLRKPELRSWFQLRAFRKVHSASLSLRLGHTAVIHAKDPMGFKKSPWVKCWERNWLRPQASQVVSPITLSKVTPCQTQKRGGGN